MTTAIKSNRQIKLCTWNKTNK